MKRLVAETVVRGILVLGGAAVCVPAHATSFDLPFGVEGNYKFTLSYSAAMRMQSQHPLLTDGQIDPLQARGPGNGQLVGFDRTGLPNTSNFDDGNRNFEQYDLINNRVSALAEFVFERDNLAFVLSATGFYDNVYMRSNANDNAEFLNRFGPDGEAGDVGNTDEFSDAMVSENGRMGELLEAYAIADFPIGESSFINIRLGQQLVTWGEALFFGGMAREQGPADANKAFVPGAEVKDILLPKPQISMLLGVGFDLTFKGYYQFEFQENRIFPVGSYFSPSDIVGPGGQFAYGSINPAFLDGCPGLLPSLPVLDLDLSQLCNAGGLGGALLNARPEILTFRESDIRPDDTGMWGVGLDYRLTMSTNVGFHYLRYHNANPAVNLNTGFAPIGSVAGIELTTGLINQAVPVSYNIKYFDDIELYNFTFSSTLFGLNVAGELNYRDGVNIDVLTIASGVQTPIARRGETGQVLVSAIQALNPPFLLDELNVVGEAQYIRLLDVDPLTEAEAQDGIQPVGDGDEPFFSDDAAGFQLLVLGRKRNVLSGWDLSTTLSYAELTHGHPVQAGAFGSLFGEDDRRLTVGFSMQYLQNFQLGTSYNWFFGNPDDRIGGPNSLVRANPYTDRDYLTFTAKYQF